MYDADRGLDELEHRRSGDSFDVEWLVEQMRTFVDLHPALESPVGQLASWLARLDEDD
jgi:hypothetical protein